MRAICSAISVSVVVQHCLTQCQHCYLSVAFESLFDKQGEGKWKIKRPEQGPLFAVVLSLTHVRFSDMDRTLGCGERDATSRLSGAS